MQTAYDSNELWIAGRYRRQLDKEIQDAQEHVQEQKENPSRWKTWQKEIVPLWSYFMSKK